MTVVVTGGVACGKSHVVSTIVSLLGERVVSFSSDDSVHRQLLDEGVIERICADLNDPDLRAPDGSMDRDRLRVRVMGDSTARRQLESILHPGVFADLEVLRRGLESSDIPKVLVAEIPLYYEVGPLPQVDMVIAVASSQPIQVERMRLSRGLEEPEAIAVIQAQLAVMDKVIRSDRVIWNDGRADVLDAQVRLLAHELVLK
jgi:dephospho-CoA kinase